MKSSLRLVRCLTAAICMLGGISANATESGYYFGLNLGQSSFDTSYQTTGAFTTTNSWSLDDSDSTWSFAIGYRVNPYFGLELAYVDLGEVKFVETGRVGGPASPVVSVVGDSGTSGALVDLFGTFPLGNFEFTARGGVFFAKTQFAAEVGAGAGTSTVGDNSSTTTAMGGLGAGYTFAEHFHVRMDYLFYPDLGDEDETGQADVSTITAGFQYRF